MALQYVGKNVVRVYDNAGGSVSLTALTGGADTQAREGDVVIGMATHPGAMNAASYPPISSPGYTNIAQLFADDSVECNLTVGYKRMGSTPDTNFSVGACPGAIGRDLVIAVYVWRNVDSVTSLDITPTTATGIDSGIPNAPSISPITPGSIVVAIGANGMGNNAWGINAAPSGYTNFFADDSYLSSSRASIGAASKAWASGAEDPGAFGTAGTSTSCSWCAVTIALRPTTPPVVTTQTATDIESDIATANGNITSTGTPPVTRRGFVYDTISHSDPGTISPETSDYDFIEDESGSFSAGAFSLALTGLSQGTQYYMRAFAYNGFEYDYGSEQTFTTEIIPINTVSSSNITESEAQLNGEIIAGTIVRRGFVYGKFSQSNPGNVAPALSGYDEIIDEIGPFGNGAYSLIAENLDYDDIYYFRAFVEDSNGDFFYGTQLSFSTLPLNAPIINYISPIGSVLNIETQVTIIGHNFYDGVSVDIDDELCSDIVLVDSETITVTCPISEIPKVSILTVENLDGQKAITSFSYLEAVPPTPQPGTVSASFSVKGIGVLR